MKNVTNHEFYEIWNEYTCESVYCDFKPTSEDVVDIARQCGWWSPDDGGKTCMWLKYIKVSELKPVFSK